MIASSIRRMRFAAAPMALLGLLVAAPGPARASAVVFQDTFDTQTMGLARYALTGWTMTGNVDVLGPGFHDFYPGNGRYLDLDGTCGTARIQTPPIPLSEGFYDLSFEMGSNSYGGGHDNSLEVTLGSIYTESFAPSPASLTGVTRRITVAAPATATLAFRETDPTVDCGGTILDDVLLVDAGIPTSLSADPAIADADAASVNLTLRATLTNALSGAGIDGMTVEFVAGSTTLCSATTSGGGVASCGGPAELASAVADGGYTAVFAGQGRLNASSAGGSIVRAAGNDLP